MARQPAERVTRRRAPGTGSLYYDADRDRWRGELEIGRDPKTGRRVKRKVSDPDEATCTALLDKLVSQFANSGEAPRRDTTIKQLVRDALDNPPAAVTSPKTVDVHENLGRLIILSLGHIPAVRLTPRQVEQFLKAMAQEGYATKTISMTKSLIVRSLRRGERDGLLSRNVAEIVETPRGTRRKSKALTEAQVNTLLASGLTVWWRAWVLVGASVGLRPGELLGLGWEDVDLDEGIFRVRYALHEIIDENGRPALVRAELKNDWSKRTLQLDSPADLERVRAALLALKREQAANKLRYGPAYEESEVIFCIPYGKPMWHQNATARFKAICSRAGLGDDWTTRELRHTFCSQQSDAGVDIEVIADAMGHTNSNVTRTVYRHQLADKITIVGRTPPRK